MLHFETVLFDSSRPARLGYRFDGLLVIFRRISFVLQRLERKIQSHDVDGHPFGDLRRLRNAEFVPRIGLVVRVVAVLINDMLLRLLLRR